MLEVLRRFPANLLKVIRIVLQIKVSDRGLYRVKNCSPIFFANFLTSQYFERVKIHSSKKQYSNCVNIPWNSDH